MRKLLSLFFATTLISGAGFSAPTVLNAPGVRAYHVQKQIPSWTYQPSDVAGKSRLRLALPERPALPDTHKSPWVKAVTTKVTHAVPAGSHVTVAFWARVAPSEDWWKRHFGPEPFAYAYAAFRAQDRTRISDHDGSYLYTRVSGKAVTLSGDWKLYTVDVPVTKAIPKNGGQVALYLSGKVRALDLGPTYVLPNDDMAALKNIKIPYTVRDVLVHSKGADISATYVAPADAENYPAILLENEAGCPKRTGFDYLTDRMIDIGFASMVYDRRDCGTPKQKLGPDAGMKYADDLSAVFRKMQSMPEVDADKTGILAVGEGAMVAQYVAANGPEPHFLAMLNPTAPDLSDPSVRRLRMLTMLYPDKKQRDAVAAAYKNALYVMSHNKDEKAAVAALKDMAKAMAKPGISAKIIYDTSLYKLLNLRFLLPFDGPTNLSHIRAPMLVITGGNDLRVKPKKYATIFHRALKDNPESRIISLPGREHFFLSSKMTEFHGKWRINPPPYSDGTMLEILTNWLIHVNGLDIYRMD